MTLVNENGLSALVTLLREGREYYVFAAEEVHDPEVADAFALAAKSKTGLLDGLVAAGIIKQPSAEHAEAPAADEDGYSALRAQFDPHHAEVQGFALYQRERRLLYLVQSVFRTENSLAVRRALKDGYPMVAQVARIMQRLALRREAA
jgi:hypothetical protein